MPEAKPLAKWNSQILYMHIVHLVTSKDELSANLFKERETSQLEGNCCIPELMEEICCQFVLQHSYED